MDRSVHITDSKRNVILKSKADGISLGKIAQIMKCSKHKECNAIHCTKNIEIIGRKRITFTRFDKILILRCKKTNPFESSNVLKNTLDASVTCRTIRNRLQEAGLMAQWPRTVSLLGKKIIHRKGCNVLWSNDKFVRMRRKMFCTSLCQ